MEKNYENGEAKPDLPVATMMELRDAIVTSRGCSGGHSSPASRRAVLLSALALFLPSAAASQLLDVQVRQKIEAALPSRPFVKPAKPRKMLVVTLNVRDGKVVPGNHAHTIPVANYALEQMGRRTRAYEAVFSNDLNLLRFDRLRGFGALCFNHTEGVLTEDPELRRSILDFVRGGRGFVAIHGGGGATFVQYPRYDQFPEFGEMVGGYEDGGHPWRENETVTIKVEDPRHPLTRMFPPRFEIQDQIFQFRHGYSREKLRVLLSIDTERTDMNPKRRFLPERAADKDFAIAWIRRYGWGRVFYNSLGHNPHIFWDPLMLRHLLAGIQYALGDLKADDTPSAKIGKRWR